MVTNLNILSNEIVSWIKNYTLNNNKSSLVIGISGGIDSALVSTLCAKTTINTICVNIPIYSKSDQCLRAINHINWLKQHYNNILDECIILDDVFLKFKDILPKKHHNELAFVNTKSRLRMVLLYQIATANNGLVIGTGNKIEDFGVGFFTKYGDGAVDISPIGDLTKTEVRNMAKTLNIINEILIAKPTDGLWDVEITDEEQLGATYEELEWAMDYMKNLTNINNNLTLHQLKILEVYKKFNKNSRHKIENIPIFKK